MSWYRCAMCGSSKITTEIKQEGYNTKKGITGAIIFGNLGALAGTSGNKVTYYHCGDCGEVLNHAMPENIRIEIDIALINSSKNEDSLKRYKRQYKNIEWEEPKETFTPMEDTIIDYFKKHGPIIKIDITLVEFSKKIGVEEENHDLLFDTLMKLTEKGWIKPGQMEDEDEDGIVQYVLITDVTERKRLIQENKIAKKKQEEDKKRMKEEIEKISILAKKFAEDIDFPLEIIKEKFLHDRIEKTDEIFTYLKENNFLSEEILDAEKKITHYKGHYGHCFRLDFISSYVDKLLDQKVLDYGHEPSTYRIMTKEIKEMEKETERLAEIGDYTPILQKILSKSPMTVEDIYKYLEKNGYIPEYVINAAKSNDEIPYCFVYQCLNSMNQRDRIHTYYNNGKFSV